ncbi:NADAR family protein [Ochrobactrum phage vB_OspM_OC]|nr:NADAR family protein [Ochrobactrum phage vB_OspM_OC]
MPIDRFIGEYEFLSNFYPCDIHYDGYVYPSVEHAYQAAKTLNIDLRYQFMISGSLTAGQAKREGKKLPLRNDWEDVKLDVMKMLVFQKFLKYELSEKLTATSPHDLIEGNTWGDTYWGICNGKGSNHLGKILMDIRTEKLMSDILY